jgi:hypothetical protein
MKVKKKNGEELICVVIHICMEMSEGNSLCSYLKQAKMSFCFLIQNQRTGGRNRSCWELVPAGAGECRERCRRVNMVQILCTHVCKWKNDTC